MAGLIDFHQYFAPGGAGYAGPNANLSSGNYGALTPDELARRKAAADLGAGTISTGYLYGVGTPQTAQDQMGSVYNDPNAVHNANGTITLPTDGYGQAPGANGYAWGPVAGYPTPSGTPSFGGGNGGTTIGQLAGGGGGVPAAPPPAAPGGVTSMPTVDPLNIPGGQPNYPLNIGAYMNPMLGFMLKNGFDTISNGAAAAGNLNSGNTLKALMQYGMGVSGNAFDNAANIASGQQQFAYGVDNNDRNFAYNAANNDRNFAYNAANNDRNFDLQRLLSMAGLGMQGAGQQSNNDRLLATLISQNMINGGQIAGAGTVGSGNAISQAISQAIANWMKTGGAPTG